MNSVLVISILILGIILSVCGVTWHVKLAEQLETNASTVDFGDWLLSGLLAYVLTPITIGCIIICIIARFA